MNSLRFLKIFSFLFVFLIPSELWASVLDSSLEFNAPIQWQQLKLQQNIEQKISRSLSPVLAEKDYIIEVKIEIDPNFTAPTTPKKITKGKQSKKIKYTNGEQTKDDGDYVVFSKFGLEAPAVGDDEVYTETSEAETTQKAIIEVSNHFNIFNYLKGIEITLTFDTNLSNTTKDVLKKIVSGLRFNYNNVIPQINIRYLELKPLLKPAPISSVNKESVEKKFNLSDIFKFNNLDLALSVILATLMIAAVMIYLGRQKKKEQSESASGQTNAQSLSGHDEASANEGGTSGKDSAKGAEKDDKSKASGSGANGTSTLSDFEDDEMRREELKKKTEEGLERFRKALNNHFDQTIITLKKIIKSNKEADGLALKTLTDTLTDSELSKIFQSLSIDERNTWKTYLDIELDVENAVKAFNYISARLMEAMMLPLAVEDIEIFDFLVSVPPKDAAAICQEDIELAVILTNMVSTDITAEMFKLIPEPALSTIIEKSLTFSPQDLERKTPLLKEKIKQLKQKNQKPPFIMKVVEMLPSAQKEIEVKLYKTLQPYFEQDELQKLAMANLPKCLLGEIPDSVFKFTLSQMPTDFQVKFLTLLDEEERINKLNILASAGSKAREILELEIEAITKNPTALNKLIKESALEIQAKYLKIARESISKNIELQLEVQPLLTKWFEESIQTLSTIETTTP